MNLGLRELRILEIEPLDLPVPEVIEEAPEPAEIEQ
jgi:hypothetical protein